MTRKKQKENTVGYAGETKRSRGNIGEQKRTVDSTKYEFMRKRCEKGWEGIEEGGERETYDSSKVLNSRTSREIKNH